MNEINKHSNPIEAIIDFAWAAGADRFWVNNAKDELKKLKSVVDTPVAYAKTNNLGDLYDLRLQNNPYDDQNSVVPLYRVES
jgi:hypothetical protein